MMSCEDTNYASIHKQYSASEALGYKYMTGESIQPLYTVLQLKLKNHAIVTGSI